MRQRKRAEKINETAEGPHEYRATNNAVRKTLREPNEKWVERKREGTEELLVKKDSTRAFHRTN